MRRSGPPPDVSRSSTAIPDRPSLAIAAEVDEPGHPLAPRVQALRSAGWDVDVLDRPRRLARLRPDVVHLAASLEPAWLAAAEGTGARLVVGFSGDDLGAAAIERPERYRELWDRADAIQVESEALGRLAGRLGAAQQDVAVIAPVPGAAPPAEEGPAEDGVLHVVSIAPLTWAEGHEYALQGIRLLADRGIRCEYRIVGDGPFLDAISFARYQLGLEDDVEVRPARDGRELAWAHVLLSAAVVPVSPKRFLDAAAAGLLCVATEALGEAVLVPRRDPEAIASALASLAACPLRRSPDEKDGLSAQLEAYADLYGRLATPRPRA